MDFLWQARKAGFTAGVTGAAFIHHFGMVTQNAIKKSGTSAYATQNLVYFQRKWGRTVRGNWLQRRVDGLRDRWLERMETIRYGHRLVERG